MAIKHTFHNPVADDPSFSGARPSHWNADHTIEAGTIPPKSEIHIDLVALAVAQAI